jgi:DNA-binding transcriptional regulator YhcF (GntR family)
MIIHASRLIGAPLTTRKMAKYIDCKERTLNKMFNILKKECP